jgi:hypothetical protein
MMARALSIPYEVAAKAFKSGKPPFHFDKNRNMADKYEGRCRCPDDSGSCEWCDIYYGRFNPESESA